MLIKFLLLPLTFTVHAFQAACFKEFSRRYMKNLASYFLFNTLYFSLMIMTLMIANGGIRSVDPFTVRLSVLQSVIFISTTLVYMKALASGPYAFTILIYSCSLVVPVLAGIVLWHEKISFLQLIGLALILVTLYFASRQGAEQAGSSPEAERKPMVRWLLLTVAAMLLNGLLMAVSKYHQIRLPGEDISEFLILVFLIACAISLVLFFVTKSRLQAGAVSHLKSRRFALLVVLTGIIGAAGSYLLHYLESVIPATVLYPSMNGGFTVVSAVLSVIIFKEKMRKQSLIGLLTGLTALVLISLG